MSWLAMGWKQEDRQDKEERVYAPPHAKQIDAEGSPYWYDWNRRSDANPERGNPGQVIL